MIVDILGWPVHRFRTERLEVDVLPAKGGEVLAVRWLPLDDLDVLWTTPWGIRHRGALPTAAGSITAFMEAYFGGWQTIFPNGGSSVEENGAQLGFHGETCLAPFAVVDEDAISITMRASLVRTPFTVEKRVSVGDASVSVTETIEHTGSTARDVMWSQHPAFSTELVDGARLDCDATWYVDDEELSAADGDVAAVKRSWPAGPDDTTFPVAGAAVARMGYLGGFEQGRAAVVNDRLGVRAELRWDAAAFPHAWLWVEAGAGTSFPWFGRAHVVGVEPATSYPGGGLHGVRTSSVTQVRFEPGERRSATVELVIEGAGGER